MDHVHALQEERTSMCWDVDSHRRSFVKGGSDDPAVHNDKRFAWTPCVCRCSCPWSRVWIYRFWMGFWPSTQRCVKAIGLICLLEAMQLMMMVWNIDAWSTEVSLLGVQYALRKVVKGVAVCTKNRVQRIVRRAPKKDAKKDAAHTKEISSIRPAATKKRKRMDNKTYLQKNLMAFRQLICDQEKEECPGMV
eukprot:scaffold30493_cov24-Tisochrysis_lutea.AAC.1